jgi:RHS repeat-associated protein
VWLDDQPVGLWANGQLHYIEPDHLGTPRAVIDPVRDVVVWKWDATGEAFGADPPVQDPDGDGTPLVFDMRFPGQRYDSATELNYNYFRDYDASTGRYVQSDPIGLWGGSNTYAYARQTPVMRIDPKGLLDKPGDGGSFDNCPLVAQSMLIPPYTAAGPLSVWLCIYDCNTMCPGSVEKLHTEIQWDIPPHTGCYSMIPRPKNK